MAETDRLLSRLVRRYRDAQNRGPSRGYSSIQQTTPVSSARGAPAVELQETAAAQATTTEMAAEPVATTTPQAEENTRLLTEPAASDSEAGAPTATKEGEPPQQTASTDPLADPPERRDPWPLIGFILAAVATVVTILVIVLTNSSHTNNTTYVLCINGTAICPGNVHYDCNTTTTIPFPCKRHDKCNPFANDCNSPFGQCVYNQTCMCFNCVCLGGYITYPNGTYCHAIIRPPPCPINPCQNDGVCVYHPNMTNPNATNQFQCICPPSTSGEFCQFAFCTSTTQIYGNQTVTPFANPTFCALTTQGTNRLWVAQSGLVFVYDIGNQTFVSDPFVAFTSPPVSLQVANSTEMILAADFCNPGGICIAYYNIFGVQGPGLLWEDFGRCGLIMDPDNVLINPRFAKTDTSGDVIVLLRYENFLLSPSDCLYALRFSSNFTACLNTRSLQCGSISSTGAAMDRFDQLYYETPSSVVSIFDTHNFTLSPTVFLTLADIRQQPIPMLEWAAAQAIRSFSINEDVFAISVPYLNWTNDAASAILRFNLNTSEWLPPVLPDFPALAVDCPVFTAGKFFYTGSDIGPYPFLFSQTCVGTNHTAPDCSGDCGPSATCQDGFCRCTWPWFNGNFPLCTRRVSVPGCSNFIMTVLDLPISCESVPMGAPLNSLFQAQQPYSTPLYVTAFGSPFSSDTFVLSTLTTTHTSIVVSRVLPPPDDRDFVFFTKPANPDDCPPSYVSFHYNVSTFLYLGLVIDPGDVIALYDYASGTTINSVTFQRLASNAVHCLGNKPWVPIFIAPDTHNTIWAIISTVETLTLVRYTSDLIYNLSCQNLGPGPLACSAFKSESDACFGVRDATYSCAGLFQDILYVSPGAGGSGLASLTMYNFTLNSTYAAFPMITSYGNFTLDSFGTNWDMNSFSQFRTTGDLLVEFRVSSFLSALRELGLNQSVISQQTYSSSDNIFTIFPNYAGGVWMSSRFLQQQASTLGRGSIGRLQELDVSLRTARLNLSTSVCQLGQNGGCGIRQCVETPLGNTRCDVCRAFFGVENVTMWSGLPSDFLIQYLYTDPFDTKTLARRLFVAGNSTTLYLVDLDTEAVTKTVPTALIDDIFQLSMSLDTHTHVIYAAARSHTNQSGEDILVVAVDYLTGASLYNLSFSALNLSTESNWTTKGMFVNFVRLVFLALTDGTDIVLFKLESNLTVINRVTMPSNMAPVFDYRFVYDLNMIVSTPSTSGSAIRFCGLGGVGYATTFSGQVLICFDFTAGALYYGGTSYANNIYRFDTTAWGAIAFVTLVTIQSSSPAETVWSVKVIDRYGLLLQTIPLQWLVRAGVDYGGSIRNVHLSVWGDLFAVNSDGRVLRVACRKYS